MWPRGLPVTEEKGKDMNPTVLLVDDTKTVLMFEKMLLAGTGFNIDMAQSGMQALEKLDERKPDIILLDIMMPGMNGIEFCRRVRESERFSDIPIIIVTTKGEDEIRQLAFAAGCNDFITKPLTKTELLEKINEHLA